MRAILVIVNSYLPLELQFIFLYSLALKLVFDVDESLLRILERMHFFLDRGQLFNAASNILMPISAPGC